MNNVNLIGNLGQDPDVKYFENDNCVAQFNLAVKAFRNGEKTVDWIPCKVWGKSASVVAQCCRKGSKVGIEGGAIKKEEWIDKTTGEKRSRMFVNSNRIELLDSKQQDSGQARPPAPQPQSVPAGSMYEEMPF